MTMMMMSLHFVWCRIPLQRHTVLRDSRTVHAIMKAKYNRAAGKGYSSSKSVLGDIDTPVPVLLNYVDVSDSINQLSSV